MCAQPLCPLTAEFRALVAYYEAHPELVAIMPAGCKVRMSDQCTMPGCGRFEHREFDPRSGALLLTDTRPRPVPE